MNSNVDSALRRSWCVRRRSWLWRWVRVKKVYCRNHGITSYCNVVRTVKRSSSCSCCFSHSTYWSATRKNNFTQWPSATTLVVCWSSLVLVLNPHSKSYRWKKHLNASKLSSYPPGQGGNCGRISPWSDLAYWLLTNKNYFTLHCRSTPVGQLAPRNLLTRWGVSSIPANGIFLTKN